MDRGAWWVAVSGFAESDITEHTVYNCMGTEGRLNSALRKQSFLPSRSSADPEESCGIAAWEVACV